VLSLGGEKPNGKGTQNLEKNKFLAKRGLARKIYNNHPEEIIVAVMFHNFDKTDWKEGCKYLL
jgi:hypothetical protein